MQIVVLEVGVEVEVVVSLLLPLLADRKGIVN